MHSLHLFLAFLSISLSLASQTITLSGNVQSTTTPLPGAHVRCTTSNGNTVTDVSGRFSIDSVPLPAIINVSYVGFNSFDTLLSGSEGDTIQVSITLVEDYLGLSDVVVTASRVQVPRYEAILPVFRLTPDLMERSQAVSLAEGLTFSPGLRVENNCSTCGFTQVRMNGLGGPYTQILLNSRPVFSALMGVYGLEMIPAGMLDRIEVVRGGGSSLYGGSAIAGTINIITRQPTMHSAGARLETQVLPQGSLDNIAQGYATTVSRDNRHGVALFTHYRQRDPWDANGDGLSELTKLRQGSFGWDYSYRPTAHQLLRWNGYLLQEFRRGGSHFDRLPHQASIAEQLTHRIGGSQLSWEGASPSKKFRYAVYGALQQIRRDSYYGAGGRLFDEGDTLTKADSIALNAYGNSQDIAAQAGLQATFTPGKQWVIIGGAEWQYNGVRDNMPGYNRFIRQQTELLGTYLQAEWSPHPSFTLHGGIRSDMLRVDGQYGLVVDTFLQETYLPVVLPRWGLRYKAGDRWMLRLAFAEGYRGPQAFDEDLHIETVGGAARFIQLSSDLQPEQSRSLTSSLQYTTTDKRIQQSVLLEGFVTRLAAPFLLTDAEELPNGVAVLTKTNGDGARVSGITVEWSAAAGRRWQWQSGLTLQQARFNREEVLWSPVDAAPDSIVSTRNFLRTPAVYGFWSADVAILPSLNLLCSGNYTGPMTVARTVDIQTEFPELRITEGFWEVNFSMQYVVADRDSGKWTISAGVRNLFNAFQQDIPTGIDRDAGYIYGPLRPRSVVCSLRFDR